jgi:hypothetical protein
MKFNIDERDIQKVIEESSDLTRMRGIDQHLRAMIAPLRAPIGSALDSLVAEMQEQARLRDEMLRPYRLSEALNSQLVRSIASISPMTTTLFDAMHHHQDRRAYFTTNATQTQMESLRLLGSIKADIDGAFPGSSLRHEIERITGSIKFMQPTGMASLAATIDGIRDTFVGRSQSLQAARMLRPPR